MCNILLSRDDFRNLVFNRDNNKCVICGEDAVDAHHIIERKLFDDGGYYLNNGASLCSKHHLEAEMTILSPTDIRNAANITSIILPNHFYVGAEYDKWGNDILPNGQRLRGEMFDNEPVQKVLERANLLNIFTDYVKYPRTAHAPWSESVTDDDKIIKDLSKFIGRYVVITEKMDGENTSLYTNYEHARSINSNNHPSRDWVKNLRANIGYNIPDKWRICGENLYAKHSIHYCKENNNELSSYFYMFSIWNELNVCMSWDETVEWAYLLELDVVPVLYEGIWDMDKINEITSKVNTDEMEGYVIRLKDSFHYSEFKNSVCKYVRKNHVQTSNHWTSEKLIKNSLK